MMVLKCVLIVPINNSWISILMGVLDITALLLMELFVKVLFMTLQMHLLA